MKQVRALSLAFLFLATMTALACRQSDSEREQTREPPAAAEESVEGTAEAPAETPDLGPRLADHEPARLLDTLLCCALIEARSCERFAILAERAPDAPLRDFYRGLLASEARHHGVYLRLAGRIAPSESLSRRLRQLAEHESAVLAGTPPLPRMHA